MVHVLRRRYKAKCPQKAPIFHLPFSKTSIDIEME